MRIYIYKVIIFAVAIIIVFEFTIGKKISQINQAKTFTILEDLPPKKKNFHKRPRGGPHDLDEYRN